MPSNYADVGTKWYDPQLVYTYDGYMEKHKTYAWGFWGRDGSWFDYDLNIPLGATINGIEVKVFGERANSGACYHHIFLSNDNGSTWSEYKDTGLCNCWEGSSCNTSAGSLTDLWGLSWDSNSANNIRVRVQVQNGKPILRMDALWVDINYTMPLEEIICTDSDSGKDYYNRGKMTYNSREFEDYCSGDTTLNEYICYRNDRELLAMLDNPELDVDESGSFDVQDEILLYTYYQGVQTVPENVITNIKSIPMNDIDFDGDGKFTEVDASLMFSFVSCAL